MTEVTRREALKIAGAGTLAGVLDWSAPSVERATKFVAGLHDTETAVVAPKFFTAHEWKTVRILADIVIPKDDHSGSATDAKAPEFVDYMLAEPDTSESSKVQMRGGLAWLDNEMRARFGTDFISASDANRHAVLDDIAWPTKTTDALRYGTTWFTRFRSSIGSAFFSSAMGWRDLQYMGNVFNPGWNGCPKAATDKLGVSYEEYDASLAARRRS